MVEKIPAQSDSQFKDEFKALEFENSVIVETSKVDPQLNVYKCKLRQYEGIGYWIGNNEDNLFAGYTLAKKENLNKETIFEVARIWVDPSYRGIGLSKELMSLYGNHFPIISDHEGITEAAYYLFTNIENSLVHFYDTNAQEYVDESELSDVQKFSAWGDAKPIRIIIKALNK